MYLLNNVVILQVRKVGNTAELNLLDKDTILQAGQENIVIRVIVGVPTHEKKSFYNFKNYAIRCLHVSLFYYPAI